MTTVLQDVQKLAIKKSVPVIKPGQTVRIHQKIKEGEKERVQMFEGLVIKVNSGSGADKTFTVRKIVDGIGVEKIFPLYSPIIEKIEVKKEAKVRRAKLYYMRKRSGKSARLKESFVSEAAMEDFIEEAVEAQEEKAEEEAAAENAEAKSEEVKQEEAPAEEVKAEEPAKEEAAPESAEAKTEEAPKEEEKKEE